MAHETMDFAVSETEGGREASAGREKRAGRVRRPLPRRARRGLIGVMLTVIVMAIAVGIALAIFGRSTAGIDTQGVQTALTALEGEIRRSFANARTYSAEDYHDFLAVRMPENAVRGAEGSEEIRTPWGGEITAGGGTTVGTSAANATRFWIHIADLPRSACITLAETYLDRSTVVEIRTGDTAPGTVRANRAAIETGCDGGDNDGVGIVFRG